MATQRYDSVLISIDWISFRYLFRRGFRAYILVVTADTNGTIGIYESPESYNVLHRPMRDKPATIDFGFDGFVIYSSAGAVPDLVRFDVFVVKEKSKGGRRAGAVREAVRSSADRQAKLDAAEAALASAGSDGGRAAEVAAAVSPVLEMVGGVVETMSDEVIEAYSGSKIFDGPIVLRREAETSRQINQAVVSPTGNIETKVDITLFERQSTNGRPERPERPPQTPRPEPHELPLDAATVAVSLRRPRVLYRIGWITAALVPLSVWLAGATSDPAPGVSKAALVFTALGIIVSPALVYGAGHWARARSHLKGLTRLGWVAFAFHMVSLACIALGVALFIAVLANIGDAKPTSIGEALGIALGSVVAAAAGFGLMVLVSLLPWLVSIITGLVFGRRSTREVGPKRSK